jgi:hypothetical protein
MIVEYSTDVRENTYLNARSFVTFFVVSYCDNKERVIIFAYDTKEFPIATTGEYLLFLPMIQNSFCIPIATMILL